jgi:hypothetical protein
MGCGFIAQGFVGKSAANILAPASRTLERSGKLPVHVREKPRALRGLTLHEEVKQQQQRL